MDNYTKITTMQYIKRFEDALFALYVFLLYLFTVNDYTKDAIFYFLILYICLFLACSFLFFTQGKITSYSGKYRVLIYLFISIIILWVGFTGWFSSPYFYFLYIVASSITFLLKPLTALFFVLVLAAMILPQSANIDKSAAMISLSSLFILIPASTFLGKVYVNKQVHDKTILMLEEEKKENFSTLAEEFLNNKVTRFSSELRQPLSDIKQIVYFLKATKSITKNHDRADRVIILAEDALVQIQTFEEESTGKNIIKKY